jgi:hypothetical protein
LEQFDVDDEGPMTPPHSHLTRRRLLGLGLATAGAVVLESVPGTVALARDAGGPRATSAVLGLPRGRRIGPVDVPGGLDLAGLRWSGHAHPRIELRARRANGRWTEWLPIGHAHDHGPDADGRAGATDPVWLGRSSQVELRLDRPVDGLTLHTVRTDGVSRRPLAAAARRRQAPGDLPTIVTRAEWGGDRLRTRGTPAYGTVEMAFVHHTVNANDYGPEDSAGIVLAIAKYHINSNGWNDVGYNFLVDQYGQIFEGRAGGMDQPVIGAQAQGFNSVSTGVANIGTFEDVPQSDAAVNAMAKLIAWKLALHGVPAAGETSVVCAGGASSRYPKGRTVTFDRISGHRDGCKTSCPGSALYAQLPELRRRAIAQDYPVALPDQTADSLTVAAAAAKVAAYSDVEVSGFLRSAGGPLADAVVAIQARGATRWNTLARARTDASGHYAAPVTLRANARLRAYFAGTTDIVSTPAVTSPVIDVTAVPALTAEVSTRRVRAGGQVRVSVDVRPNRSKLELAIAERGKDGRYRTVRRHPLKVRGAKAAITVRLTKPGLYRFIVSAPADAKAAAASTPQVFVRVTKGATRTSEPVRTSSGGAGEPLTGSAAGNSGGAAASAG